MMNECRHLLSELEKGTKFILLRSGDKYMSMGHNGSKGRIIVKPIGHLKGVLNCFNEFMEIPASLSGNCHVRVVK